jgi:hypothetical protein
VFSAHPCMDEPGVATSVALHIAPRKGESHERDPSFPFR